jgi:hypothetical protein
MLHNKYKILSKLPSSLFFSVAKRESIHYNKGTINVQCLLSLVRLSIRERHFIESI